ncbi:MAG: hypothetical protein K2Y37_21125 [Pirellulales bacterium]|nr:hypothetical protein [Pirellulales bacterium]
MAWSFSTRADRKQGAVPAIPIVLGIVGHRTLCDEDRPILQAALERLFAEVHGAYPHTPLTILTSLAEGADQIAAVTALACGASVRAALPFPPDIFRQSTSFDTEPAREQFDRLIADARIESFVVPMPIEPLSGDISWIKVATDRNDRDATALRRACYANTAGYIVRHCHALVALWDGDRSDTARPGGTAESVAFKLHGRPPTGYPVRSLEPLGFASDRGPVYIIHAARKGTVSGKPVGVVEVCVPVDSAPFERSITGQPLARRIAGSAWLASRFVSLWRADGHHSRQRPRSEQDSAAVGGLSRELRQFQQICQSVDDFNRDVQSAWRGKALEPQWTTASAQLANAASFGAEQRAWLERLCAVREAAAFVSRRMQRAVHGSVLGLFGLIGLSAAVFHVYAHGMHWESLLLGSIVLLGAAFLLMLAVRWRRCEERQLDCRALAEALRVRRYWAMAGIGVSVADSYVGQLRGEMTWARHALRHLSPPPAVWARQFQKLPESQQLRLLSVVRDEWVRGQTDYYRACQVREHHAGMRCRKTGFVCAVAGWVLLVLILAIPHWSNHPPRFILVAAPLLITIGGLAVAYGKQRSYEELSNQYERLRVVFQNGLAELDSHLQGRDIPSAQRAVMALGEEALTENGQWLILRRARPLELHLGG